MAHLMSTHNMFSWRNMKNIKNKKIPLPLKHQAKFVADNIWIFYLLLFIFQRK